MRISGETMIFSNAHESRDGTWYTYATGVSSKRQDGTYVNSDASDGDPIACYQGENLLSEEELKELADNCMAQKEYLESLGFPIQT